MLVLLTSQWRQRAAAFLVALYALCLLAPATAFALSDSTVPAHCVTLTDEQGDIHADHHDGMDQASHSNGDHGLPGKCCGLFCVTALAPPAFDVVTEPVVHAANVAVPVVESLFGRSSNRIDRPPRALFFV